jgi:hypothetical protein
VQICHVRKLKWQRLASVTYLALFFRMDEQKKASILASPFFTMLCCQPNREFIMSRFEP